LRKPQQRQIDKINRTVKECEEIFQKRAAQIDEFPRISDTYNGMDFDAFFKEMEKELLKTKLEQYLTYEFCHEFNWDWQYYMNALNQVLAKSPVFARIPNISTNLDKFKQLDDKITMMKEKYMTELRGLDDIVVEYNGNIWLRNIQT